MNELAERLHAQTRINPITTERRVKEVQKLEGGSLRVSLNNGTSFNVNADDEMIQSFIVYTMLDGA